MSVCVCVCIEQEEGWPLGLQPLNVRVGLERNRDLNASLSFNTLLTSSPISSDDFSSDLDTLSTGSFFHDKSITLGSLIGISSILELSRRSRRGRAPDQAARSKKTRTWFLSLCSRLSTDAVSMSNAPSLAHLLQAERTAAGQGVDDFSQISNHNTLFVGGHVAPPRPPSPFARDLLSHHHAPPLLLSCLCAQSSSN
ncbi:uncharacterized protein At3g17950-like [Salvia splendens]|uniref:uncharacterized protein At3g17950-like n=1 Tax=Salvia splendens TaxID=180675 RepID=UPI001C26146A|nr:uncharacterized protein At3g17950-like [Salvia splendens]